MTYTSKAYGLTISSSFPFPELMPATAGANVDVTIERGTPARLAAPRAIPSARPPCARSHCRAAGEPSPSDACPPPSDARRSSRAAS